MSANYHHGRGPFLREEPVQDKKKKRLLRPPAGDGEIMLLPSPREILSWAGNASRAGTAHQAAFFQPGIALKFLLLDKLPVKRKEMVFVDTDRTLLRVNLPPEAPRVPLPYLELVDSEKALARYPRLPRKFWEKRFGLIEEHLEKFEGIRKDDVRENFSRFQTLFFARQGSRSLKEVLAESFLAYFEIERPYRFLTELLASEEFQEFFQVIRKRKREFRRLFNQALDDYKKEFKFRYKSYPFPRLRENELPFWIMRAGRRYPLFAGEDAGRSFEKQNIFPRAVTLTLFLRLYQLDLFIHGVGGGNYEWIQDRLLERFYGRPPPPYIVISGTFLLDKIPERDFPYFFYSPETIKKALPQLERI